MKNTGASGERAREGISINAGLASLGKVISQLSSRHPGTFVSYRDSKLTRLLQDSLGGNAITYMIACVTPAEFHLSETLNTVQYAQRARAIQSKPQLQQVHDDGDKQAVIDRLRAEISFLRQQIRSSEAGPGIAQGRLGRQHDRDVDLQNQLLDAQENYTALSQRHAKLISEITKARNDNENAETPTLTEAIGDSAVERLKRSNSFAEAVEQVVLEYEKTIQSLESSLSGTRSTLLNTESILLERENRCSVIDGLNQQLQNRIQKYMDRETTTDEYLKNLEQKLDSQTSGDAKSNAIVSELRKEISRARENEAQCEEYISTLEERLAEADQDLELKQRELDRLEHVIERQRSIGKLDSLLYEFDHLQNGQTPNDAQPAKILSNGVPKSGHGHKRTLSTLEEAAHTTIPESDEEDGERLPNGTGVPEETDTPKAGQKKAPAQYGGYESPAQKRAVDDQLENVTQQLFDLQINHESTARELDMMHAKYEEALRTLAQMQDTIDENRHGGPRDSTVSPASTRPASFLGDARVAELKEGGEHASSSRSLSSELSLAGDSNTSLEPSVEENLHRKRPSTDSRTASLREEALVRELEDVKRASTEKEENLDTLTNSYNELHELYAQTQDIVEELTSQLAKSKMNQPQPSSPVIRRKSSQNMMTIDRAHRSLASLKNLAADNFEKDEDLMQNFELNLNTLMHELHQRSERVQLLEHELSSMKKDLDNKNSMISGLTRERSSMKASSPIVDMSVMTNMNDQLVQREQQMNDLQHKFSAREQELAREVASLKIALEQAQEAKTTIPGLFPETPAPEAEVDRQLGDSHTSQENARLQQEIGEWESKHKSTIESMEASKRDMLSTIAELESTLTAMEQMKNEAEERLQQSEARSVSQDADSEERKNHVKTIEALRKELEEQKTTSAMHVSKLGRLAELQEVSRNQAEEAMKFKKQSEKQMEAQQAQITQLEGQVQEHQAAVDFHKHGLKTLHDSHASELAALQATINEHESGKSEMERSVRDMETAHKGHLTRLESDVVNTKAELEKSENQLKTFKSQLENSRDNLRDELEAARASCHLLERQREEHQRQAQSLKAEVEQSNRTNKRRIEEMEKLRAEKDRAANLIEELEEQLNHSYDQQQANTNRISQMHNTHDSQAKAVLEATQASSALRTQLENSQNQVEQLQVSLFSPSDVN